MNPFRCFPSKGTLLSKSSVQNIFANGARETNCAKDCERRPDPTLPRPPSSPKIVDLNNRWRVIDEDRQWILQKRKGRPTKKSSGYRSIKFHRSREGLHCSVRELCGAIGPDAQDLIGRFPEHYPLKEDQ